MLPIVALFLVVATLAVLASAGSAMAPALLAHAFFAAAALPLMFAAILHFVPVLTRSEAPAAKVAALPWLAATGGMIALLVFAGLLPRHALLLAAGVVGAAALSLAAWIGGRMRRSFGAPHPGVRWYIAALSILVLGMLSASGVVLDPSRYGLWRQFHLHANLFGWVGLTALGTLPVLVPTVLRRTEADAAARLRRNLPFAASGAVALALGAAFGVPLLGAAGALLLLAVIVQHGWAWQRSVRIGLAPEVCAGVAVSLMLAALFLGLLLVFGAVHGFGLVRSDALAPAFVSGFLLPLVTGALAHLIPMWRFPGPATPRREAFRRALGRHAGWRGLALFASGCLELVHLIPARGLAAVAVIAFLAALAAHWRGETGSGNAAVGL